MNEEKPKSFIIARTYFSSFVQFDEKPGVYEPRVKLIFPDENGNYHLKFDWGAREIDLTYIASKYNAHRFKFQRQIGVGDVNHDVKLAPVDSWQEYFLTSIQPFLQEFILDQRYGLEDAHQKFLGDWMAEQQELITPRSSALLGLSSTE